MSRADELRGLVEKALKRAFCLGQTYWQQADSQYTSDHKRSDVTLQNFKTLTDETLAILTRDEAAPSAAVCGAPVDGRTCYPECDCGTEKECVYGTKAEAAQVGDGAIGEVIESDAVGRAIRLPRGWAVTLDALPVGTKIYAGSPPTGGEHMALHWIERYAAGIDDEPQIDMIRDALTHPQDASAGMVNWIRDAVEALNAVTTSDFGGSVFRDINGRNWWDVRDELLQAVPGAAMSAKGKGDE